MAASSYTASNSLTAIKKDLLRSATSIKYPISLYLYQISSIKTQQIRLQSIDFSFLKTNQTRFDVLSGSSRFKFTLKLGSSKNQNSVTLDFIGSEAYANGAAGSRTPVRRSIHPSISHHSLYTLIPSVKCLETGPKHR